MRRVHAVQGEPVAIAVLPGGKYGVGEGVLPAKVVPVGDVLAEHDDRLAFRSVAVDLAKQRVGRWAVGAAFRREELDKDRPVGRGCSTAGWLGDLRRGK